MVDGFRVFVTQPNEGTGERGLILDGLHAPDGTEQPVFAVLKRAPGSSRWGTFSRLEEIGIDAIRNQRAVLGRDADGALQIVVEVLGNCDVMADERLVEFSDLDVARIRAIRIMRIPAMFGVDARRNTGKPAEWNEFKRSKVTGMKDVRFQLPEQSVDLWVQRNGVPWLFVQCYELHIGAFDTFLEVADCC